LEDSVKTHGRIRWKYDGAGQARERPEK